MNLKHVYSIAKELVQLLRVVVLSSTTLRYSSFIKLFIVREVFRSISAPIPIELSDCRVDIKRFHLFAPYKSGLFDAKAGSKMYQFYMARR